MSIDWSKAPEGATHWDPGLNGRIAGWMRLDSDTWYWWSAEGAYSCPKKWHAALNQHKFNSEGFTERPTQWSGEGLPPVGVRVEVVSPGYSNKRFDRFIGETVTIVAHDRIDGDAVAVFRMAIDGNDAEQAYHALIAKCFRPIRTAEQIAAEEREKAITEMLNVIRGGYATVGHSIVRDLYAAGYRKQEATQ